MKEKMDVFFWAVVASDTEALRNTSVYLLISKDKGKTWEYGTKIAKDKRSRLMRLPCMKRLMGI